MNNYRTYIREAIKSPIDGTSPREFGKWAILNGEQRKLIGRLLDEMDSADAYIKKLYEETQQLKEKINTYENPDDLTLFYMWLDEKAKDKLTELRIQISAREEIINKAIEYIEEYGWQEDIISNTCSGVPMIDKYMRLDWDNCNELLEILKGEDNNE